MNTPLYSGIITNYVCTAACKHCMFASSPDRPKDFISSDTSRRLASLLRESGGRSVHIGGGEPFVNFPALCSLIEELRNYGVGIDYIETNAFWCKDDGFVRDRLTKLKGLGVTCIMASVDPFHIEFVPLDRVIRLIRLLDEMGFEYFVWKEQYLRRLIHLDRSRTYTHEELCGILGDDYVTETAREYGIGINGRALAIAGDIYDLRPAEELLTERPCPTLLDTCHCHLDLYGNIVPSGCPGLVMDARDYLEENTSFTKYPVMTRLVTGGIAELYRYACEKGFEPSPEGYPTKCALCYAIRKYLVEASPSDDLSPKCFYSDMKKYVNY